MAQTANVYPDSGLHLPLLGSELVCIVAPSPHRSLIRIEAEPQPAPQERAGIPEQDRPILAKRRQGFGETKTFTS